VTIPRPKYTGKKKVNAAWPKPSAHSSALSVDGSFDADGNAGTGMVLRNSNDEVLLAAYRHLNHCNDAMEAELSAIMVLDIYLYICIFSTC
jgi:hypothetical protein